MKRSDESIDLPDSEYCTGLLDNFVVVGPNHVMGACMS